MKRMHRNGWVFLSIVAFFVFAAALGLAQPASASCVYIDGCTYCVNDGGCCWQVGACGCIEFQCRASAPPTGFLAAEVRTTDWWAAVVAHDQAAKPQPSPAGTVLR
jgi:hypothetical protein